MSASQVPWQQKTSNLGVGEDTMVSHTGRFQYPNHMNWDGNWENPSAVCGYSLPHSNVLVAGELLMWLVGLFAGWLDRL